MAVGRVGIVGFDAERLERPHVSRDCLRATERSWRSLICSMMNIGASLIPGIFG
jgi:hypothetical protein